MKNTTLGLQLVHELLAHLRGLSVEAAHLGLLAGLGRRQGVDDRHHHEQDGYREDPP